MPRSHHCLCCGRDLTVLTSIERGLGPICFGREAALADSRAQENGDHVDLPFDPERMDIMCERRADGLHFNIFQVFVHHSPTGFEFGYPGSGPADFALNIAALFTADLDEPRTVTLYDGKKISATAWNLHQKLKFKFVATLPRDGGVIKGELIRSWISEEIAASKLAFAA